MVQDTRTHSTTSVVLGSFLFAKIAFRARLESKLQTLNLRTAAGQQKLWKNLVACLRRLIEKLKNYQNNQISAETPFEGSVPEALGSDLDPKGEFACEIADKVFISKRELSKALGDSGAHSFNLQAVLAARVLEKFG